MGKLLTTSEVAGLLRVSRGTVINWINAGKISHIVLPSGQFRVPESELNKILCPSYSDWVSQPIDDEL